MTPGIAIRGAEKFKLMNSIIFLSSGIAKTMPVHNRQRRVIRRIATSNTLDMNEPIRDKVPFPICKLGHYRYKNKRWGWSCTFLRRRRCLHRAVQRCHVAGVPASPSTGASTFYPFLTYGPRIVHAVENTLSYQFTHLFTDSLCHMLDMNYVPNVTLRTMTSNKGAKLAVCAPGMLKKFSSGHFRLE